MSCGEERSWRNVTERRVSGQGTTWSMAGRVAQSPKPSPGGTQRVSVTPEAAEALCALNGGLCTDANDKGARDVDEGTANKKRQRGEPFSGICALCKEFSEFELDPLDDAIVCTTCGVVVDASNKKHQPFKLPDQAFFFVRPHDSMLSRSPTSTMAHRTSPILGSMMTKPIESTAKKLESATR